MTLWKWSKTAANNSNADSTINWAEGQPPSSVNDSARAMMAAVAKHRDDEAGVITTAGSSVAYTATTNQAYTANGDGHTIVIEMHATSGVSPTLAVDAQAAQPILTATGGSAPAAGAMVIGGIYRLTDNGTAWILNGIVGTLPGTVPITSGGTGAVTATAAIENLITPLTEVAAAPGDYVALADVSDGDSGKKAKVSTVGAGKHTLWVPASSMYKLTASAGPATAQFATSSFVGTYLAYDASTFEDAHFLLAMPKGWDEGTITAQTYWFHGATTTNFAVLWQLFASAYGNDDPINGTTFGSANMLDTGGTTNDLYISPESSAITIGNSPAEGDLVHFIMRRNSTDGSDTLAVDAFLLGVKIFITTNANTDD